MYAKDVPEGTIFYHGTKADLQVGELLEPGFGSNFVERGLKHIYFTATLEAAAWGAELAKGEGRGRIYILEPTGTFADDTNLTDQKIPGNMTASYRSLASLRVTGEVQDWACHSPEQLEDMRESLARLNEEGAATIIEYKALEGADPADAPCGHQRLPSAVSNADCDRACKRSASRSNSSDIWSKRLKAVRSVACSRKLSAMDSVLAQSVRIPQAPCA